MLAAMRSLLIFAGLVVAFAAPAQEIYRWVDKDGVVHYSDQPGSNDAVVITVIEPNAYEPESPSAADASGSRSPEPPESDGARYQALSIVSPTPDQVFFGADTVVTATAEIDGTLHPDHSVVFFLNGNRHEAPDLSAEFTNLARGSYTLSASILDGAGRPVISSEPTTFHVRQPSINAPQSPQAPKPPRPRPRPLPATPR